LRGLEGAGEGGKSWPSRSSLEYALARDFALGKEEEDDVSTPKSDIFMQYPKRRRLQWMLARLVI
jgi:hypothetical protein